MNRFLDEEERQALVDEIPMGRMENVEEVADLAYYLAVKNAYP